MTWPEIACHMVGSCELEDEPNPDRLLTQNLGKTCTDARCERYDRMKRRDERQQQSHKEITSQECHVGTQSSPDSILYLFSRNSTKPKNR